MRVFFALWPEPSVRQALQAVQRDCLAHVGGRGMRPDTLHLTLVFIGDIGPERLPDLLAAAGQVRAPACEIEFDRLACWRHNRIAHLACSQAPAALQFLVEALESAVAGQGINFDHRPYHPHITLIRQADCQKTNPASPVIHWRARDFVLLRSALGPEGASYQQLGCWSLAG